MKHLTSIQILISILLFSACCEQKSNISSLIGTDKAFSAMSVDKGLNAAFIYYADDSVTKLRDGAFPITGKDAMAKIYLSRPDTGKVLKWYPVKAEASASSDLGYTFGNWELYLKARDTTLYGNYITIWKRQPDGTWRYVIDSGVNTPKPE